MSNYKQDGTRCELWSEEYFIDKIERTIKHEISMHHLVERDKKKENGEEILESEKHPTEEHYKNKFSDWVSKLKFTITNFDLGNYD